MNHANRLGAFAVAAAGSLTVPSALAQDAAAVAPIPARTLAHGLGMPVDAGRLAAKRGGNGTLSDMQLRGVVSDNRAVNVTTGANAISEGAFSGMAGLPLIVQNTGSNVLIQNATIINVQVK